MAWLVELTPSANNLLAALWQILGLHSQGLPQSWADASEKCATLGMGKVRTPLIESVYLAGHCVYSELIKRLFGWSRYV